MPISLPAPAVPTFVTPGVSANLTGGSFRGLTWGPGTDFHISRLTGLDDLPSIRVNDSPRPFDHGNFSGYDYADGRLFGIDFTIIAPTNTAFHSDLAALQLAFATQSSGTSPLYIFGSQRVINCRVRQRTVAYDATFPQRQGVVSVQLYAPDPRIYDATQSSVVTGLANPGTGATFPLTFPFIFHASPNQGGLAFTNNGNADSPPVFTLRGPVTTPQIQNLRTGQQVSFAITLADQNDVLTVDMRNRTVMLNTYAPRRSTLVPGSQWFTIVPGTNTITYQAYSYNAQTTLTMLAASAWI